MTQILRRSKAPWRYDPDGLARKTAPNQRGPRGCEVVTAPTAPLPSRPGAATSQLAQILARASMLRQPGREYRSPRTGSDTSAPGEVYQARAHHCGAVYRRHEPDTEPQERDIKMAALAAEMKTASPNRVKAIIHELAALADISRAQRDQHLDLEDADRPLRTDPLDRPILAYISRDMTPRLRTPA